MNSKSFRISTSLLLFSVFVISLVVSSIPMILDGPQRSADSNNFLRCADLMLEEAHLGSAITRNLTEPWCRLYTGFLVIFSTVVHHFDSVWPQILAGLNVAFHALAITSLTALIHILFNMPLLSVLVAALLIFSVDILIRVHWPIADSFFFLMATLAFVGISLACFKPTNRLIVLSALILVLLAGSTKPHGLAIGLIGIITILFRHKLSTIAPRTGLLLISIVIISIASSFVIVAFVFDPSYRPIALEDAILKEFLLNGQVIEGVYSTYNQGTENYFIRLSTILERFLVFFSFFPPHWSTKHIIFSSIFFVPWYLGLISCWVAFSSRNLDSRVRCLILLSSIWILSFATIAGWFDVSYEFRYRFPLMTVFAFQAVLGLYLLVSRTQKLTTYSRC